MIPQCSICGKTFKNLAGLAGHIQLKHPEYKYVSKKKRDAPYQPQQDPPQIQQQQPQQYPRQMQQQPYPPGQPQQQPQQYPPQIQQQYDLQKQLTQLELITKEGEIKNLKRDGKEKDDQIKKEREGKEKYRNEKEEIKREQEKRKQEQEKREQEQKERKRDEALQKQIDALSKTPEPTQLPESGVPPPMEPKKEVEEEVEDEEAEEGGMGLRGICTAASIGYGITNAIWGKDWVSKKIAEGIMSIGNRGRVHPSDLSPHEATCAIGQVQQILTNSIIEIDPSFLSERTTLYQEGLKINKSEPPPFPRPDSGRIAPTTPDRVSSTDPRNKKKD